MRVASHLREPRCTDEQIVGLGVPLCRLKLHIRTLHPQFLGVSYTWTRGVDKVAEFKATYAILNQDCYRSSPFRAIFDEGVGGSANAFVPGLELDYPILEELRVAGATGCCRRTWNDGDRQMVAILSAVLTDGLTCVEAACAAAPQGVIRIGTSTVRPTDILQQQSPYNLTSSP